MSDYVLTDEQRTQIAKAYLTAARNNTEHQLIDNLAKMPSSDYKEQYGKILANAYVYEIQALKDNMQSDQPNKSYIQNYTAKLIAENNVPDSIHSVAKLFELLSREGAHQNILDRYAKQLQGPEL